MEPEEFRVNWAVCSFRVEVVCGRGDCETKNEMLNMFSKILERKDAGFSTLTNGIKWLSLETGKLEFFTAK